MGVIALAATASACGGPTSESAPAAEDAGTDVAAADTPAEPTCPGADLQKDARNCGRCGHDCLGGACEAGDCEPYVFADGLVTPIALSVTKDAVYLAESKSRVTRIDRASGTRTTIASGQKYPYFTAATDEHVAWSNAGDVTSAPGATLRG